MVKQTRHKLSRKRKNRKNKRTYKKNQVIKHKKKRTGKRVNKNMSKAGMRVGKCFSNMFGCNDDDIVGRRNTSMYPPSDQIDDSVEVKVDDSVEVASHPDPEPEPEPEPVQPRGRVHPDAEGVDFREIEQTHRRLLPASLPPRPRQSDAGKGKKAAPSADSSEAAPSTAPSNNLSHDRRWLKVSENVRKAFGALNLVTTHGVLRPLSGERTSKLDLRRLPSKIFNTQGAGIPAIGMYALGTPSGQNLITARSFLINAWDVWKKMARPYAEAAKSVDESVETIDNFDQQYMPGGRRWPILHIEQVMLLIYTCGNVAQITALLLESNPYHTQWATDIIIWTKRGKKILDVYGYGLQDTEEVLEREIAYLNKMSEYAEDTQKMNLGREGGHAARESHKKLRNTTSGVSRSKATDEALRSGKQAYASKGATGEKGSHNKNKNYSWTRSPVDR